MTKKEFRILSTEELETQVQILKEYYWVKSKAGAIKKAIKDCATVAEHTNVFYWFDQWTDGWDKSCEVKWKVENWKLYIKEIKCYD